MYTALLPAVVTGPIMVLLTDNQTLVLISTSTRRLAATLFRPELFQLFTATTIPELFKYGCVFRAGQGLGMVLTRGESLRCGWLWLGAWGVG